MPPTPPHPITPDQRALVLTAERNLKMARSAHAYVRGNTRQFYEWLEACQPHALPEGPAIWICGDCHIGNLGPIASLHGHVEIQIRDLDQTVVGNPVHDLIRLGLSLAMAARGSDLPGVTSALMIEQMVESYTAAMVAGPADDRSVEGDGGDDDDDGLPAPVELVMKTALGRSWKHLARERLTDVSQVLQHIPLGKNFWPLAPDERTAIERLFEKRSISRLATQLGSRDDDARVELVDAAYWMKGCSSLGRLRYAVVLGIEGRGAGGGDSAGRGRRKPGRRYCLMDLKEAVPAAAPVHANAKMPRNHGLRVVEGARHLSPHLGDRMLADELMGKPIFMRELLPQDLKLEIAQLGAVESTRVAGFLAGVVGKAHARQMDAATARRWRAELQKKRSKTLDAPSWLWNSVVDLVASHEAQYLEHCRHYAMRVAA